MHGCIQKGVVCLRVGVSFFWSFSFHIRLDQCSFGSCAGGVPDGIKLSAPYFRRNLGLWNMIIQFGQHIAISFFSHRVCCSVCSLLARSRKPNPRRTANHSLRSSRVCSTCRCNGAEADTPLGKKKKTPWLYRGWITTRWFQIFFMFNPIWGRFPCWLIFFKRVETTN